MNEELKIIIRAVTSEAQKNIDQVKKSLQQMETAGNKSGKSMGTAMAAIGKGAAIAVGSVAALAAAFVTLGKNTMEYYQIQTQLVAGFQSMGLSAETAKKTFADLYVFLGERYVDNNTEAASQLAQLTQNTEHLAEWTHILQGVYATFSRSLPVEILAEAANETANTGKIVGGLADALNWAGVSEVAFQEALDKTTSMEEREALIRTTLNQLYSRAADIYERNNKTLIQYNRSQIALDQALADAMTYILPLMTNMNNLATAALTYLKPAFETVTAVLIVFCQWVLAAIVAVGRFFGVMEGKTKETANDMTAAAEGANGIAGGMNNATDAVTETSKEVQKLKRQLMGFDELNVISSDSSSSGNSGSGSGSGVDIPGVDIPNLTEGLNLPALDEFEEKVASVKKIMDGILPIVLAIGGAFAAWKGSKVIKELQAFFVAGKLKEFGKHWKTFADLLSKFFTGNFMSFIDDIVALFAKIGPAITSAAKAVAAFIGGIGAGTIIAIVAVVVALASAVYFLWKNWDGVTQAVKNFFAENVAPKFEKIKSLFVDMWEAIKSMGSAFADLGKLIWDALPPGVQEWLVNVGKAIKGIVAAVVEWFKSVDWLKAIGEVIEWLGGLVVGIIGNQVMTAFSTFARFLQGLVEVITGIVQIISGIVGGFINLIVALFTGDFSKCLDSVKMIWEGIKNVFSGAVNILFGWIYEFVKGVIDWFTELWDVLVGHSIVPDMVEAIIDWFLKLPKQLISMISNFVKNIINFFKNLASNAGTTFSNMVTNIKKPFQNIADWFKNIFTKAWNGVKNVFSSGGVIFDGIKSGISGVFTTVVNGLIGGINKVIAVPFNSINGILNGIRNIDIAGIKPFSGLWKNNPLAVPQIPKLATGGLVDGATLAMIGERGREAVLPLENNTGWMDMLADRIAARNNTPSKIVLQVGQTELGWANIHAINRVTEQTGNLQLIMP